MRAGIFISIFLISQSAFSQSVTKSIDPKGDFDPAQYGIMVLKLRNDSLIVDHNSSKSFIPASLVKLVTATGVLRRDLNTETIIKAKTCTGNKKHQYRIFQISGTGDPTFCSPRFGRKRDLARIVDSLVSWKAGQDSIFIENEALMSSPVPGDWKYADLGNYYAAGLWTLNYQDNRFKVVFRQQSSPGMKCRIERTIPENLPFRLKNNVLAGHPGSGDNAYIFGGPYSTRLYINGTIPPGNETFTIKGAHPEPPEQIARDLRDLLKKRKLNSPVVVGTNKAKKWIWLGQETPYWTRNLTLRGPSTQKMLGLMLKKSDNLLAEYLYHKGNSKPKGEGIKVVDGSGLSKENRLNPKWVVRLLSDLLDSEKRELCESLPVGGESGTLSKRFKDTKLESRVYAKTGSMSGVQCLAGYIVENEMPTYAFCYMINTEKNIDAQVLQNRMDKYLESLDLVP